MSYCYFGLYQPNSVFVTLVVSRVQSVTSSCQAWDAAPVFHGHEGMMICSGVRNTVSIELN
jgi:hypothetical protein